MYTLSTKMDPLGTNMYFLKRYHPMAFVHLFLRVYRYPLFLYRLFYIYLYFMEFNGEKQIMCVYKESFFLTKCSGTLLIKYF